MDQMNMLPDFSRLSDLAVLPSLKTTVPDTPIPPHGLTMFFMDTNQAISDASSKVSHPASASALHSLPLEAKSDYMHSTTWDDQIPRNRLLRLVGNASRDLLLELRNLAYIETENQIKGIRESYAMLLEKLSTSTLAQAPTTTPSKAKGELTAMNRQEYPKVPFWTRGEWASFKDNEKKAGIHSDAKPRGRQKDRSLPNKALAYITDAEGVGVDGYQAHAIRDRARLLWAAIAAAGCAPPTWSQAHITSVQYYRREMYDSHPNLRLCEGDWKVDMLAIDEYPGWYRPRKENISDIKPEPDNTTIGTLAAALAPPMINPKKRHIQATDLDSNAQTSQINKKMKHESSTDELPLSAAMASTNAKSVTGPILPTAASDMIPTYVNTALHQNVIDCDSLAQQSNDAIRSSSISQMSSDGPTLVIDSSSPPAQSSPKPAISHPILLSAPAQLTLHSGSDPSESSLHVGSAHSSLASVQSALHSAPAELSPLPAPIIDSNSSSTSAETSPCATASVAKPPVSGVLFQAPPKPHAPAVTSGPTVEEPGSGSSTITTVEHKAMPSMIINPFATRKPSTSAQISNPTQGSSSNAVPPNTIETKKKNPIKANDTAIYYPNKTTNSHRNLFGIDYSRDHPKTTKADFEIAWKLVEADKGKKAFYVKLGLHNKANSLKPDMNGSASTTLT
ncbi:hypothetical protein JB92DRAFT_3138367 [Gautieria morchelliformis]|nr:hypothetical protein JB92DRAFT_3138367 [Gautieria morchelliformis]